MKRFAGSMPAVLIALLSTVLLFVGSTITTGTQLLTNIIVMHGTGEGQPDPVFVTTMMNNFILPTNPQIPVGTVPDPLYTPEEAWPLTGLTSLNFGQSVRIGTNILRSEAGYDLDTYPGEPLIIFGASQSAVISNIYKKELAAQYPATGPVTPPDITFVFIGDLNRPNGGVMTRFQGAYVPFLNFYFNGPAPTDTPFKTYDIAQEYDGFADFPNYPLNIISVANAVLGILYVHSDYKSVSVTSCATDPHCQGDGGTDTTYYFIPTAKLPLLNPIRGIAALTPLVTLIEPALKVIVDAGYDRSIAPWVPTKAKLFGPFNPIGFTQDLVAAIQRGIDDVHNLPSSSSVTSRAAINATPKVELPDLGTKAREFAATLKAPKLPRLELPELKAPKLSKLELPDLSKLKAPKFAKLDFSKPSFSKPSFAKPTLSKDRPLSKLRDAVRKAVKDAKAGKAAKAAAAS